MTPTPAGLPLADLVLLQLATPDRRTAAEHCAGLVRDGLPLDRLVDDGLAPAMAQVGSLWETAVWSVADEHLATAAAEAGLSAAAAERDNRGGRGELIVACVEGDWHSLPARMVAETLATHGWSVRFLGASCPTSLLVDQVTDLRPDAVLLGCAVPMALPALMGAVRAVHDLDLPVYVGGRALGTSPRRAQSIGADGWAVDTAGAVAILASGSRGAPGRGVGRRLAVHRARELLLPDWADAAVGALVELIPTVGDYPPDIRRRTHDDLLHVLEMACVSLLLHDPTLLEEQSEWLGRVLTARGVPPDALPNGLTALREARPPGEHANRIDAALHRAQQHLAGTRSTR